MNISKALIALSLGFALAACTNPQQAEDSAAEAGIARRGDAGQHQRERAGGQHHASTETEQRVLGPRPDVAARAAGDRADRGGDRGEAAARERGGDGVLRERHAHAHPMAWRARRTK